MMAATLTSLWMPGTTLPRADSSTSLSDLRTVFSTSLGRSWDRARMKNICKVMKNILLLNYL